MTSTVVARGADWGAAALNDGWGADTDPETAEQLGRLVVDRFHELVSEQGGDANWLPSLSEVQAEVYGRDDVEHSKWDEVYPLPSRITYASLREQAQAEVWDAFCGEGGPMTEKVNAILNAAQDKKYVAGETVSLRMQLVRESDGELRPHYYPHWNGLLTSEGEANVLLTEEEARALNDGAPFIRG